VIKLIQCFEAFIPPPRRLPSFLRSFPLIKTRERERVRGKWEVGSGMIAATSGKRLSPCYCVSVLMAQSDEHVQTMDVSSTRNGPIKLVMPLGNGVLLRPRNRYSAKSNNCVYRFQSTAGGESSSQQFHSKLKLARNGEKIVSLADKNQFSLRIN
jgi:hypothetical protein